MLTPTNTHRRFFHDNDNLYQMWHRVTEPTRCTSAQCIESKKEKKDSLFCNLQPNEQAFDKCRISDRRQDIAGFVTRVMLTPTKYGRLFTIRETSTKHENLNVRVVFAINTWNTMQSLKPRVANITDFSVEVRNSENDTYFSKFLYRVSKFSVFFYGFCEFLIFFNTFYRTWSSETASSDKKYIELNGAVLNVNKPCVTSQKTDFLKHK